VGSALSGVEELTVKAWVVVYLRQAGESL